MKREEPKDHVRSLWACYTARSSSPHSRATDPRTMGLGRVDVHTVRREQHSAAPYGDVRTSRNMPGIVPILRGPINTQYIPILAGLAEWQSSNLFQYLQKSCSRIANIPFGGSTRPVMCRSGRAKSLIDPIEPPTIAQECCAITQIPRNVRLERFSEPPT